MKWESADSNNNNYVERKETYTLLALQINPFPLTSKKDCFPPKFCGW